MMNREGPLEEAYCSLISAEGQEDPIGSASSHERYVFVEVPLPWAFKVEESKHFPVGLTDVAAHAAAEGKPFRLLGFASDVEASPAGHRRVMFYERPDGPLSEFGRAEYVVPDERLIPLVQALTARNGDRRSFAPWAQTIRADARDLFVCTHGVHDRCCGQFGYPMYKQLLEQYAAPSNGKLRVWRTSHIGGHRHAPTAIDFPEGRYWAKLRAEVLEALVRRSGTPAVLARHYRGWGAFGPFAQAAERELFVLEGWDWIGYRKQAALLRQTEEAATVRIDYERTGGERVAYVAEVECAATVQTGGCGRGVGEARQYNVIRLEEAGPSS